jgi:hypothetical protein
MFSDNASLEIKIIFKSEGLIKYSYKHRLSPLSLSLSLSIRFLRKSTFVQKNRCLRNVPLINYLVLNSRITDNRIVYRNEQSANTTSEYMVH